MENQSEITLITGLGNPGLEYKHTRHNFGFLVLDALAAECGLELKKMKFKALVAEGRIEGKPVVLAKPLTFMNDSGVSVAALVHYFKIDLNRLLVIHDELDLPFGSIRLRAEGGTSGQKGMGSIIAKLGTQAFPRMRLGIGRPTGQMEAADYVLQRFAKQEEELLKIVLKTAVEAAQNFVKDGLVTAMNRYNGEAG
ncbi:MAG: aminoacyl-tRNA hydrolase [Anaerolineaceae bacterium]|nr:aminoacyl-tRNA hydrolase [Anaerolineaceae bacterium]